MDWTKINRKIGLLLMNQHGMTVTFMYDGIAHTGCRSQLRAEAVNTNDGLAEVYRFSLLCPVSQFKSRPKEREPVDLNGEVYRILSVDEDATSTCYRLNLGEKFA